jgi:hypothetical protein
MTDLFGGLPNSYTTRDGRTIEAPTRGKHYVQPRGGADRPGTGPQGETCGSCQHLYRVGTRSGKSFPKCLLNRAKWTHGGATDVRVRWAACSKWEAREPAPSPAEKMP